MRKRKPRLQFLNNNKFHIYLNMSYFYIYTNNENPICTHNAKQFFSSFILDSYFRMFYIYDALAHSAHTIMWLLSGCAIAVLQILFSCGQRKTAVCNKMYIITASSAKDCAQFQVNTRSMFFADRTTYNTPPHHRSRRVPFSLFPFMHFFDYTARDPYIHIYIYIWYFETVYKAHSMFVFSHPIYTTTTFGHHQRRRRIKFCYCAQLLRNIKHVYLSDMCVCV